LPICCIIIFFLSNLYTINPIELDNRLRPCFFKKFLNMNTKPNFGSQTSNPNPSQRPNNNNRSFNKPRPNQRGGGYRRDDATFSTPDAKKSNAIASEKTQYIVKKEYTEGYPLPKKTRAPKINPSSFNSQQLVNFANPHIQPHMFQGPRLQSFASPVYPQGPEVRIIPIGGASEVGMNMSAIECGDDIIVIDAGFAFGGGDKYPGVDYILPDITYLEQNKHKIRGVIFTHAHLDHIGGAPYLLPKLGGAPIYGMPLTLALLKNRLSEFEMGEKMLAKVIDTNKPIKLGKFEVECFRLNHSLPDCVGLYIRTPMGNIIYCTDWKFDQTPYNGQLSDFAKISQFGNEGVRLLLTDSLGIMKPGYQMSERVIGNTIQNIVKECQGRVIITAFSTTVSRIQFTIDSCVKTNRKLALVGRSMVKNFKTCYELGYINVPADLIVDIRDCDNLPPQNVCILTTGSQGEDKAALARMSRDEHPQIRLQGGDSVIFSSGPIPGNEGDIQDLIASLSRKGVEVYRNKDFDLHVSGHACHEDLKLMFAMAKPDYLLPIHGDHWMIKRVAELGANMGISADHCLVGENGRIVALREESVEILEQKITENVVLVDGTSIGAVSEVVLDERRQLGTEGAIIVIAVLNKKRQIIEQPGIISRGYVYMKNNQDIIAEIKKVTFDHLEKSNINTNDEAFFANYRNLIKTFVADIIFQKTEKQPMIIPVVVQI
jgi:ribonuclease J